MSKSHIVEFIKCQNLKTQNLKNPKPRNLKNRSTQKSSKCPKSDPQEIDPGTQMGPLFGGPKWDPKTGPGTPYLAGYRGPRETRSLGPASGPVSGSVLAPVPRFRPDVLFSLFFFSLFFLLSNKE